MDELARYVVSYLRNHAPGLYEMLNILCLRKRGRKLMELLMNDPPQLYQLLLEHYGDEFTATFAFSTIIRPMLIKLGILSSERDIVEKAKRDPNVFRELLRRD